MARGEWTENYENIIAVANFLVYAKDYSRENLLDFIEKPYNYDEEYKEMKFYIKNEIYPYGDNELA